MYVLMEVKEEIKRLDNNLQSMEQYIKRLDMVIAGDSKMGVKGIVNRVEDSEEAIKGFNKLIDQAKAIKTFFLICIVGGITSLGSFIYFMFEVLDHIKK